MGELATRTPLDVVAVHSDNVVSDRTSALIAAATPVNTRRAYARAWNAFTAWCAVQGRTSLPATAETLAEYVTHLTEDRALSPASVEQAIAAIRRNHRAERYDGQPDTQGALVVLRGYKCRRADEGHTTQQAPPVTIDALRRMIDACDPETLIGARDQLVLVLGLAMMARRSELCSLRWEDVTATEDGLEIRVRRSKTDQDARGAVVAVPRGQHADTDPVRLLRRYREALGVDTGPLLRSVTRHRQAGSGPLSPDAVHRIVRGAAERAGLDNPERYTAHSLRAGGATVAYKAGHPVSTIAAHGRWAPASPVVLGYIRAVDQWQSNPMNGVGL